MVDLIKFVLRFKNIFTIDFYADPLASMLLRKVFCDTEKVEQKHLDAIQKTLTMKRREEERKEEEKVAGNKAEDDESAFLYKKVEEVKPFSMEEFMAQKQKKTMESSADLDMISTWNSSMTCQALHSVNQDVILQQLAQRFEFEKNITWSTFRRLAIPVWLKDMSQMKKYIELIAKNEYRNADAEKKEIKAEKAALWYILLDKRAVVQNLYSLEVNMAKFAQFFSKDFKSEKVRTIAAKNAMQLVSK